MSISEVRETTGDIDILGKLEREKLDYENSNPDLDKDECRIESIIRRRGEEIIKYFKELEKFDGNPDKIPEIPVLPIDFLKKNVWPELIRAGAIPKGELKNGREYLGGCRNSDRATWNGEKFVYTRHKFGSRYQEEINHFQDDDGYDVFIPILEL